MPKKYVLAELGNFGLGNRLLIWGKAYLLSYHNNIPLVVRGWSKISVGTWMRREKVKRMYGNFFFKTDSILLNFQEVFIPKSKMITNPAVSAIISNYSIIKVTELPHWSDYFKDLKPFREIVKTALYDMLNPSLKSYLETLSIPIIGIHIRMGDFKPLLKGTDFSKVGHVRTPFAYFIDCIRQIREIAGSELPVTIFSDGYEGELQTILSLPNVHLALANPDIIDLLLLSKSKIVITSAGSTFSYWAGFLSDAPLILHQDHIHQPIRPTEINKVWYEGAFDSQNLLLKQNILSFS